ncbi:MAG TPA: hypothetical protein VLD35_11975 [Caldimonas sp.]|nr:hypothetical protein [Caldimonas sp.]
MTRLSMALAALLLALLGQGCAVEQASPTASVATRGDVKPGKAQQLKEITPEFRNQVLEYARFRRFLFTDPIDCVIEDGDVCPVLIQLIQVSDASGTYCVGLLPEVVTLRNTAPGNGPKRIVWKLIPPVPAVANAEFFFHAENDHGIIWLTNINPTQLHTGRLGDGSPGAPDRMKYHVMNRHRVKGEAVYVPIVMQKDTISGKIALCGTPDPRMTND